MTSRTLALIFITLLCACAAAAQGTPAASGEQAEAARLNAEVLRLYREEKYDDALPLARRVLELREKTLGPDDLSVAGALNNLAAIYTRKGKGGEAESLLRRSLAIAEKRPGADSDFAADVVGQLGRLRLEARDYKEAEPLLQRALRTKEKVHGAGGASLVPVLFNLTDLHFLRGEPVSAYASLDRALSILKTQPPRKDASTASRLKTYYCPLMALNRELNWEQAKRVSEVIFRLEKPEEAKKQEATDGEVGVMIEQGDVLNGRVISKPAPEYPRVAKAQRAAGLVVVHILVDESGKVIEAEALCGHPLLMKASADAARQARFTPTLLAGKPVKVTGVITYNYVIQ